MRFYAYCVIHCMLLVLCPGQGGHHRGPHGRPPDDDNAEDQFSNGSKAVCPGHHGCMTNGELILIFMRRNCLYACSLCIYSFDLVCFGGLYEWRNWRDQKCLYVVRSSSSDGGVLIQWRCCVWMSVLWSSVDNHALSASSSSRSTCRTRLYTLLKHSICQLVAIHIVEALQDGFGFSIGISSARHH
jgi:hypothetical protein